MELQWPLVIFTLLICLGAGTLGVAGLLAALKKAPEIQFLAAILAIVFVVLGGIASFFHLQHWDRAFNGFGHLSSGITQEIIGIVVFLVVAVVYLLLLRKDTLPSWAGWLALIVSLALVVVVANSYLMGARPVWNSPLLWLYFLSNAILFGSLVLTLLSAWKKEPESLLAKISLGGAALTLISLVAYAIYIPSLASSFTSVGNYFDPTQPTKVMANPEAVLLGFLSGSEALLFWVGAILVGVLIPALAIYLGARGTGASLKTAAVGAGSSSATTDVGNSGTATSTASLSLGMASVAIVCAFVGALCFRVALYALGYSVFVFY